MWSITRLSFRRAQEQVVRKNDTTGYEPVSAILIGAAQIRWSETIYDLSSMVFINA